MVKKSVVHLKVDVMSWYICITLNVYTEHAKSIIYNDYLIWEILGKKATYDSSERERERESQPQID